MALFICGNGVAGYLRRVDRDYPMIAALDFVCSRARGRLISSIVKYSPTAQAMGSCVHALWRGPVDSSAGTPGKRSLLLLHQGVTAVLTGPRTTLESLIYHLILLGNSKLEGVSSNAALQIQDVSIARYKAQESIIERISAIDKRSLPRPLALSAGEHEALFMS